MSVEVHSRTAILKGHPTLGIPRGAKVSVSSLPSNHFVHVFEKVETGELPVTLDPGKYVYVVRSHDAKGPGGMRWVEEFYVGCDESTFDQLAGLTPQAAKSRQTSEGLRYFCGFLGCKHQATSAFAMVEHEAAHQGISVIQEPERRDEAQTKASAAVEAEAKLRRKESDKAAFAQMRGQAQAEAGLTE